MPAAMPETARISQDATQTFTYRYKEAQLGNGYRQRRKDGINNKVQGWNIVWTNVNATEKANIFAAFDTTEGVDYLTWQPPGETSTLKFFYTGTISLTVKSGELWDINAEFVQIFEV